MLNTESFVQRLLDAEVATPSTIVGCTPEEVEYLEGNLRVRLPDEYRSFLLAAGKCAGSFLNDCDCYYPEILGFRFLAEGMVHECENGRLELPDEAFVFWFRQSTQFMWFDVTDPGSLYSYLEGDGHFDPQPFSSFWEFFETEVQNAARVTGPYAAHWKHVFDRAERVRRLGIPPITRAES